ncbi:MAG: hypothetical protein PHG96_14135, partial [Kiritimatiellae bacterium]|nr:hypothetical protein [Kiritimatiellia bacterium]
MTANGEEMRDQHLTRRAALKRLLLGGAAAALGNSVAGCSTSSAAPPAPGGRYFNSVAYTNALYSVDRDRSVHGNASTGGSNFGKGSPYSRSSYTPYSRSSYTPYSNSYYTPSTYYVNFAPYMGGFHLCGRLPPELERSENACLDVDELPQALSRLSEQLPALQERRLTLGLDCGFPLCMFTDAD